MPLGSALRLAGPTILAQGWGYYQSYAVGVRSSCREAVPAQPVDAAAEIFGMWGYSLRLKIDLYLSQ